jgi:hypothetical protein
VPSGQHICLLHRDDEERFRVLAPFFSAALHQKHKLMYMTDGISADDVCERFESLGVDFRSSSTEVQTTKEAYFPDGQFRPEAMCAALADYSRGAVRLGFTGVRCSGEMDWASRGVPGSERLLDYEAMLTPLIERMPFSGICQYDVRLFDGPTILAILELHPFLLVRGQVLENPNYVRRGEWTPSAIGRQ